MKKAAAILTTLVLICTCIPSGLAEEQKSGFLDSVGSFFSGAWSDVSQFAEGAWKDVSGWVEGAWGDASKWVEQAWNDSSTWAVGIWGDVSTWAVDTYNSASGSVTAWWTETFNHVTEKTNDAWNWFMDESDKLQKEHQEKLQNLQDAVAATGENAQSKVKEAFMNLLKQLNLNDADAEKVWKTIEAYAKEKGISTLSAAKIALPFLMQLAIDSQSENTGIPAIAIAQYLTGVVEKLGVNNEAGAEELISQLNQILNAK